MFPVGAAGYGLLILRLCAAGMLMRAAVPENAIIIPTWAFVGVIVVVLLLCLGAFTPVCCIASELVHIAIRYFHADRDPLLLAFAMAVVAALFLLGPGAFSFDSHLFGRRLIIHS